LKISTLKRERLFGGRRLLKLYGEDGVGPNMFERKTIHFMSGVKVTFGSRL
jgi:hypothetical protein